MGVCFFLFLQFTFRRDGSCLTIGCISIFLAFALLVIGAVLVELFKPKNKVDNKVDKSKCYLGFLYFAT